MTTDGELDDSLAVRRVSAAEPRAVIVGVGGRALAGGDAGTGLFEDVGSEVCEKQIGQLRHLKGSIEEGDERE
jgi:glycerate kinase